MRWGWAVIAMVGFVALAGTAAGGLAPQDDAGSGNDAPGQPEGAVPIEAGEVYDGLLEGPPTDVSDHYVFEVEEGERVEVLAEGSRGCMELKAPDGDWIATDCPDGHDRTIHLARRAFTNGTYYLEYWDHEAQPYRFSLGVNDEARRPLPTSASFSPSTGRVADVAPADPGGEETVVAVVDTGINPYHDLFAAPNLDEHPANWLEGFPASAEAVNLSLDAASYEAALADDQAKFDGLERSTYDGRAFDDHVYTFPGTRVIAGVSFSEYERPFGGNSDTPILDEVGHGTGTAGLAAGARLDEADGEVLLVAVEVGQGDFQDGLMWAAEQPWIDAISASIGTRANVPYPPGGSDAYEAFQEAADTGKPVYIASGNGFSSTGAPDHCQTYTSPFTGPPHVTRIGAADPRSENPSWWHCVPVEAIAATPVPSADHDSISGVERLSGTSAATPNAIGHWAELMQRAREHGLDVSREHVNEQLLHEARPAEPRVAPGAEPSTGSTAPLDQGYGVIDGDALDRAWKRLAIGQPPAERPLADAFFEHDRRVRELLWEEGVLTGEAAQPDQDDAGSGRDAPNQRSDEVVIESGRVYEGLLGGTALGDWADWYAFEAVEGEQITVEVHRQRACAELVGPDGEQRDITCSAWKSDLEVKANATGSWYLNVNHFHTQPYRFSLAIDGSPPDTGLAPVPGGP